MKKIFSFLTIFFFVFILTQSCKKGSHEKISTTTVDAIIKANETYQYDLGSFGIEDGASISRQATHFQISALERHSEKIIYKYTPAFNYIGTDEVEIKSLAGSDGSRPGNAIHLTTIKFTISN